MTTFTVEDLLTGEERQVEGIIVTCTTEGCENNGVGIEVPDTGGVVVCGPCGSWLVTPEGQVAPND